MGDPAGIGGEIAVAARASGDVHHPFFLIDDPSRLMSLADSRGLRVAEIADPAEALSCPADVLPVLPLRLLAPAVPGRPDPRNAAATIEAIETGMQLALSGRVSGIVTNPISKIGLKAGAGFAFAGHTEFLAALAGGVRPVMMLSAPGLRVVPVTVHVPIADVPGLLTRTLIEETARITYEALMRDFGLARPRLAVAGLNPHAGESGSIGQEEVEIIAPAVEALRKERIEIAGPMPADSMFHPAARARFDAALCMYHDQALIPLKTVDFARGVNVTLGLPVVRTSPDHGTAYDIAGQGLADPTSLIEALNLAGEMATARLVHA